MFEFTGKYISATDFSIGVFEDPLGGNAKLYSQSNYGDGKKLYLNFPDEFADAVKNAGFDLVTTANNHLLDMGLDGMQRTIAVLKKKILTSRALIALLKKRRPPALNLSTKTA